jgi:hypothetical protein
VCVYFVDGVREDIMKRGSLRGLLGPARAARISGSRVVLAIGANRKVRPVLRAEPPWTPTGLAVHGSRLYVLEYDVTPVLAREWPPRVRTLDQTGTVTTLVTLPRDR